MQYFVKRIRPDVYVLDDNSQYRSLSDILSAHLTQHPSLPVCLRSPHPPPLLCDHLSFFSITGSAAVMAEFAHTKTNKLPINQSNKQTNKQTDTLS